MMGPCRRPIAIVSLMRYLQNIERYEHIFSDEELNKVFGKIGILGVLDKNKLR